MVERHRETRWTGAPEMWEENIEKMGWGAGKRRSAWVEGWNNGPKAEDRGKGKGKGEETKKREKNTCKGKELRVGKIKEFLKTGKNGDWG